MASCGSRALLLITGMVEGTSTSVARRRIELTCRLTAGHEGQHRSPEHEAFWDEKPGRITTLTRHDPED